VCVGGNFLVLMYRFSCILYMNATEGNTGPIQHSYEQRGLESISALTLIYCDLRADL